MGWRRLPGSQALSILITAAALYSATPQQLPAPRSYGHAQAPSPARGVRPKAVATPNAVAALASALLSVAAPERPVPISPLSNTTLPFRPGRLLVKFRDLDGGNYSQIVDTVNEWAGIDLIKVMAGTGIAVVNVTDGASTQRKAARLAGSELVEWTEMDYLMSGDGSTGSAGWALDKLQAAAVWSGYTFGNCGVAVCHIDSGMPWTNNHWYNPGEYAAFPFVDDDGNGVIDDYFGANFMGGKTNVSWDYNGHGSGTSAVLGGVNNGDSSSQLGVSPKVSIMPCVAMDAALAVPFSAAIACVEWCKNNFENIAAMGGRQRTGIYVAAWGSNSLTDSDALRAVIQRADSRGRTRALFTASAGNTQSPVHVPASLGLSNIVSLTYSDSSDVVRGNTGSWIDVAAPTGSTSDAAAVGGGLAALMVAANPSLTPEQLKAAMRAGVDVLSTTQGKVGSNGRLNALKAFQYLERQGTVQKARATPDQSQQCNPLQVWYPPWPSSRLGCSIGGTNQCWTSYSSQN
ncbi:subtilisin-like protein [Coccomyxa subellipsoidea C-169]|uniref:Subtilisin-like protein n=1 Tax=Coccomyxa subellipsoidea (strain C-169) TaxID=574566 RepID=I0YSN4_COCSC|nr:subtilisin-like protein [Coccomyxa subellipsoidea C-169]EIE21403.1 subtilisin-like protein [Coccomyxa subellipsoidea C-169]|eukprot:XP_005645947.1 subtilisin-like protein [Coccomyxa subellipsoidea C-169]